MTRSHLAALLSFLTILGLINCLPAQDGSSELFRLVDKGKQQIYNFHLDDALTTFRQMQDRYPNYPHGYFYESYITAILFSQDRTNSRLDSLLQAVVNDAIEIAEKYKKITSESPEALYYLGVSYGIRGIYYVVNRNYIGGYIYGKRAKNYLEKTVEVDSTYYDAYVGLGIFHYYVDLMPGIVKFLAGLLGFHGDKEQGMKEIQLTMEKGRFFKMEAEFVYAFFRYFLEGDEKTGVNIFFSLKEQYPDNPALTLLIGYHHRLKGQVRKAIEYFSTVPDSFSTTLPQFTVIKYYNTAVCYFRLNQLQKAEQTLDEIIYRHIGKSQYYQAALSYYKGLLTDLEFNRSQAEYFYNMIPGSRETRYWKNISRLHREYKMDSLMYKYILTDNNVFTGNLTLAEKQTEHLSNRLNLAEEKSTVPFLKYLVMDLQGQLAHKRKNYKEAALIYENFSDKMDNIEDEFRRAWVYIHHARVRIKLKEWDKAATLLEKASITDDEYTNFILEKERFIVNHRNDLE